MQTTGRSQINIPSPFFRARVVEVNIEGNKYGAVRVFIPDLMVKGIDPNWDGMPNKETEIQCDDRGNDLVYEEKTGEPYGIMAYPANSPVGGYNDLDESSYYQTSVYVPAKGSFVWVFFEKNNTAHCFYMGAFNFRHTEYPPENVNVMEPHKVYTILKTRRGRSIIVSDSEDVQRIEITGKKRYLNKASGADKPNGDEWSAYHISESKNGGEDEEGNMTTILLDEREGRNKLLIKDYKGNYINLDIDNNDLNIYMKNNINIKCDGDLSIKCNGDFQLECENNIQTAFGDMSLLADNYSYVSSQYMLSLFGYQDYFTYLCGMRANPEPPVGDRD